MLLPVKSLALSERCLSFYVYDYHWRGIAIALDADDTFGMLLATGVTSMFMFHVMVNIGMTAGIMPVTGVPLPFLSYGVSSLTTNLMLVAILLNIKVKKQNLQF